MLGHIQPLRLALLAVLLLTQACVVNIEDKQGGGLDPCDPNPCEKQGVCSGWTGTCTVTDGKAVCSDWKPSAGTGTAPDAYEADETLCDGKDNDCDGLTDEGLVAAADACSSKGVCAETPASASCVGGAWVCNFAVNPAYEVSETRCDGKDNDCDGVTDEDVSPTGTSCKRAGVCAGLAPPTCEAGAWNCNYGDAADYEETEKACDGKDNDCDGFVDSNLSPASLPGGAVCPTAGVCSAGVAIVCANGKPTCATDAVPGFEAYESQCDGKDNDCDGKTDNVHGTGAPLLDADIAACATQGVCKQAGPGQITRACAAGQWACSYSGVPNYEPTETLCDGKDNDCDGDVDESLKPPAVSPCGDQGVCKGVIPACAAGIWTCPKSDLTAAGYEPAEVSCDGKDNDCDGSTDETTSPAANGCMTKGVCGLGVAVACKDGTPTCDYGAVLAYEAATETMCDGKDNDCDGSTDEIEGLDAAGSSCGVGVCAGAAKATCGGGAWQCSFDGVAGYEQNETLCDGKDNDCDGSTDEGLGAAVAATCNKAGVCSEGVVAACVGGKAVCAYQSADYQGKETLCDGKDNDCDGITDPGLCGSGQPCVDDSSCKAGTCATALGSTQKVCTAKVGQCARFDGGTVTLTESGTTICADTASTLTCAGGSFGTPVACPKDKPACQGGVCKLCIPSKKRCDPDNASDVLQCAADGSAETKQTTCASGKCAGDGICVESGVIGVSTSNNDNSSRPSAAAVGDGFIVVWFAGQAFSDTLFGRRFDSTGKAVGSPFGLITSATAAVTAAPRVATSGNGFAVTWMSSSSGGSIVARLYDATGQPASSEITVDSNPGTVAPPSIAGDATGFVVAWSVNVGAAVKVRAARFGVDGAKLGNTVEVSTGSGPSDPLTGGSHDGAAVAIHTGGGFSVAWSRSQSGQNDGVWWRSFDKSGVPVTAGQLLSAGGKVTSGVRAAQWGTGAAIAWQQDNGGSAGTDILLATVDAAGKVAYGPGMANATVDGAQAAPALAAGVNRLVLGWAAAATDGGDVMGRDLQSSGAWTPTADTAMSSASSGVQDQPSIVAFGDGRVLTVWRQRTDASDTKAKVQAAFR
ncbi:MAG: hypothetical protein H6747_07190 [Deltaproteobacteria bacterium]|nr:hypothetical protein [Deltaproteobacteria bacterium]